MKPGLMEGLQIQIQNNGLESHDGNFPFLSLFCILAELFIAMWLGHRVPAEMDVLTSLKTTPRD